MIRIVIAGESQCQLFAQVCLVADHIAENLPNFCYDRIEKPVIEWKNWLCKINQKHKWHHMGSPLIWKELLMKGSKPYYIGGPSEFFDYCHSYYKFEAFLATEKFEGLVNNFAQFEKKVQKEQLNLAYQEVKDEIVEQSQNNNIIITISGAGNPITMYLLSGLIEMNSGRNNLSKIYIYDSVCSKAFMEYVERECNYVETCNPAKVVKYVTKIGVALTNTDLLIILDHVPFNTKLSIGEWLRENRKIMENMAVMINASAARRMCVVLPNLGPACYNATILMNAASINKENIVVATSDLGLHIAPIASEIAEISMRNLFCPPVWGFVGINHLVDILTTVHKYNSFVPYNRYTKVRNSSLSIGSVTPVTRTLEYLMYFDETLWIKVAENNAKRDESQTQINKALAILNVVKVWLFDPNPDQIINLGIRCNGSFGLKFPGVFSQPARYVDGKWSPATDFMLPKDPQMKLSYLEKMAEVVMTLNRNDLPDIVPYHPCTCKPKFYRKKTVW